MADTDTKQMSDGTANDCGAPVKPNEADCTKAATHGAADTDGADAPKPPSANINDANTKATRQARIRPPFE